MKTHIEKPKQESNVIQSKTKASRQAPVKQILQQYKDRTIQRESLDDDELLQGKFETVQREEMDEDELLQGKFGTVQREEAPSPLEREVGDTNKTGLPDDLKSGIENLSGYSMDNVRVHYNSDKPAQLQALAYTQGSNIHIAPGQEKHLPHEAWHVVQQMQGRVQSTMQLQGININDNEGLEKEADVIGEKALYHVSGKIINSSGLFNQSLSQVIQRNVTLDGANLTVDNIVNIMQGWLRRRDRAQNSFFANYYIHGVTTDRTLLNQNGNTLCSQLINTYKRRHVTMELRNDDVQTEDQIAKDLWLLINNEQRGVGIPSNARIFMHERGNRGRIQNITTELRIYRTMPLQEWEEGILHNHGGSFEQAAYYFNLAKHATPPRRVCLVEFTVPKRELRDLLNDSILGGEGTGHLENNKLNTKTEDNELFWENRQIFSVSLSHAKERLIELGTTCRIILYTGERPRYTTKYMREWR